MAVCDVTAGWTDFLGGDFIAGRGVGGTGMGIGRPERGDVTEDGGEEIMGREREGMGPAIEVYDGVGRI